MEKIKKLDRYFLYSPDSEGGLKKSILKFMMNWPWFVFSVLIALAVAFFYNITSQPVYKVGTKLYIDENRGARSASERPEAMDIFGTELNAGLNNVDNQAHFLQSYSHIFNTIEKLNFEVSYWKKGLITYNEVYKETPFKVVFDFNHDQATDVRFFLVVNSDTTVTITAEERSYGLYNYTDKKSQNIEAPFYLSKKIKPDEMLISDHYSFYVVLNEELLEEAQLNEYCFAFNNLKRLTYSYQSNMILEPVKKESPVLNLISSTSMPQKAIDFQNALVEGSILRNLEKKNQLAENTILFIDNQLKNISDSLATTEERLQSFRVNNNVLNLPFQSDRIYDQYQELEREKSALVLSNKYYHYLHNYIKNNKDVRAVLAPSSMGVEDPLLNSLIMELNRLADERNKLLLNANDKNMLIPKLDAQIENTKLTILENTKNIIHKSVIALNDIEQRLKVLSRKVNLIPEKERQLIGIERKFELNDNIYTYLLERRAEAQIAKASNISDNEVVDTAHVLGSGPIKPNATFNYLFAFIIGLLIPGLLISAKDYFSSRISSREDITDMTDKPILGNVLRSRKERHKMLVFDKPNSPQSEAFRLICTEVKFLTRGKTNPIVLVSSSFPGEGKTFIAANLATGFALLGNRTVLVNFDLRKPGLEKYFKDEENNVGVSTFLSGDSGIYDVTHSTSTKNLDIITSGPVPQNPAQLISDSYTERLFEELKRKYDYIVVDTAPLGEICDTYLLTQYADANVLVARHGYTYREALKKTLETAERKEIENVSIVVNDIQKGKEKYGYNYGYSYGY